MSNEYKDWLEDERADWDAAFRRFRREFPDAKDYYVCQDKDSSYIIIIDVKYDSGIIFNRENWTYSLLERFDRP